MTPVIQTYGLTKRYRRSQLALTDCTLSIPAGRVIGLVGPNGAGKSTLLNITAGLLTPTSGTMQVLGNTPESGSPLVGYMAQNAPLYSELRVGDLLKMGAHLNPMWDTQLAQSRTEQFDLRQRAGTLSGGQRAQLALTLALAKQPELLILDEPVAALDPLARDDFLTDLTDAVSGISVILSSHLIGDLERVCNYLIVLVQSQVQIAGPVSELLASHPGMNLEKIVLHYMRQS